MWTILLPIAKLLGALLLAILALSGASPADPSSPPPPAQLGGPIPWEPGPLLSPQVALCLASACVVARPALSRVAGRSGGWDAHSSAGCSFCAGLRISLLLAYLLVLWWLNRTLAAT